MANDDDPLRVLLVTAPPKEAPELVSTLVAERLIACGNIIPGVRSFYRWKGEVCDDEEAVLIMETTAQRLPAAMARIEALHSYEVPKIVALQPSDVLGSYLAWAREQTRSTDPKPAP